MRRILVVLLSVGMAVAAAEWAIATEEATIEEISSAGVIPGAAYTASYEEGKDRSDSLLGGSLSTGQNGVTVSDAATATDGNDVSASIENPTSEKVWRVELIIHVRGWASTENYQYTPNTGYSQTVTVTASLTDFSDGGDWPALDIADSGSVSYANESQFSQYDDAHIVVAKSSTVEMAAVEFRYEIVAQVTGSINRAEMSIKCRAERIDSGNAGFVQCYDESTEELLVYSDLD